MSLLIRYAHIPFYFRFSFTFSTLPIHHYAPPLWRDRTQLHSLHWTDLTYLMDIWLMIHMYLLLFLVSPTCPLLRSNQSWVLTPRGQALSITLPYAHILVYHSYLTSLYLPFRENIITEAPTNCLYESPQNWDLALTPCTISHLFRTISHRIALPRSHCLYLPQYTWRQSLTPRLHPLRAP